MAYLIFTANGEEFDRRELGGGPVVLGRAPDCDISVPDIMLSRHHCRIEPAVHDDCQGWRILDLQSKNGTFLRGRPITSHDLHDGEELRLGRTRITFRAGAFVASPPHVRRRGVIRPADPTEALAGTISGMVLCEPGEVEKQECFPYPQPRPADPGAYATEDVYGMINQIASSSWDSIMAQNSEPIRMQRVMPAAAVTRAKRGAVRPRPRVSFCLQAEHRRDVAAEAREGAREGDREGTSDQRSQNGTPARRTRRRRPWMLLSGSIGGTGAFIALWVTLILSASNPQQNAWDSHSPAAAAAEERVVSPETEAPSAEPAPAEKQIEPVEWDAVAASA